MAMFTASGAGERIGPVGVVTRPVMRKLRDVLLRLFLIRCFF